MLAFVKIPVFKIRGAAPSLISIKRTLTPEASVSNLCISFSPSTKMAVDKISHMVAVGAMTVTLSTFLTG